MIAGLSVNLGCSPILSLSKRTLLLESRTLALIALRCEREKMAENVATVVNWYGGYPTLQQAQSDAHYLGQGLYAAVGYKQGIARGPRTLLYVGVAANLTTRLTTAHHKLGSNTLHGASVTSMWLGQVAVSGIPGRRRKQLNPHLDSVEWALTYFLEPVLNEKKSRNPPDSSCVVVNRWWDLSWEKETARPAARWADIVEYDRFKGTANLVWFGKRARAKTVLI